MYLTGLITSIWTKYKGEKLIGATSSTTTLPVYATYTTGSNNLTVFVINKKTTSRTVDISLQNYTAPTSAQTWKLKGTGPDDTHPTFTQTDPITITNNVIHATLDPVSLTIFTLNASSPPNTSTKAPTATNIQTRTPTLTPVCINAPRGDANCDGKIDGVDYVAWLSHYNQLTSNGPKDGDFNKDTKVDGIDFVIWFTNYGT